MRPIWLNKERGYTLSAVSEIRSRRWLWLWTVEVREFNLSVRYPLTYIDASGTCWQPDRHFWTDGASYPPPLRAAPGFSHEQYVSPYLHDSGYQHGGLWRRTFGQREYTFCPLARSAVDDMLADGLRAEGAWRGKSGVIWSAVRLFGKRNYHAAK